MKHSSKVIAVALGLTLLMAACAVPVRMQLAKLGDVITAPENEIATLSSYSLLRDEPVSAQLQADVLYENASKILDMRGYTRVDSGGDMLLHLSWSMEPRSRMTLDRQAELRYGTVGALLQIVSGERVTIDTVYTLNNEEYYQHHMSYELRSGDNQNQLLVYSSETPFPTQEITKSGVVLMRDVLTKVPMRLGYVVEAPPQDTTETAFRWALKNLYARDYVPPGQEYIIAFPKPGHPGYIGFDPAKLRRHFEEWNPPARYLPVVEDMLQRGWSSYVEGFSHYIIGTYDVDGRIERVTLRSAANGRVFVPAEVIVEPI